MSSEYISRLINRADVEILNAVLHLRDRGWPDDVTHRLIRACNGLGRTADPSARLPTRAYAYFHRLRSNEGHVLGLGDDHWDLILMGVQANAKTAKSIVDLCEYYWMGSPTVVEIYGP